MTDIKQNNQIYNLDLFPMIEYLFAFEMEMPVLN